MQLSYGSKTVNGKWRGGKGQRAKGKEPRALSPFALGSWLFALGSLPLALCPYRVAL
jgi:hypothetical protein